MSPLRRRRLVRRLSARDDAKRWSAASELAQCSDERTVKRIERVLEGKGHERGRVAAAYVLGFSGETEVAGVLARRLSGRVGGRSGRRRDGRFAV